MRRLTEIKTSLIKLRFKDGIPLAQIAKDSHCTPQQVMQAMQLEASETIFRRLDAYLDAGDLHKVTKDTKRTARIEWLTKELRQVYDLNTLPMRDIYLMSPEKQKRLEIAMNHRLKKALRERIQAETGKVIWFADSESYRRCKAKMAARFGELATKRNVHRSNRPGPVVQG